MKHEIQNELSRIISKEIYSDDGQTIIDTKAAAGKCEEYLKSIAVQFAEWLPFYAKVYPDGWHYKGDAMTTAELFDKYLTE